MEEYILFSLESNILWSILIILNLFCYSYLKSQFIIALLQNFLKVRWLENSKHIFLNFFIQYIPFEKHEGMTWFNPVMLVCFFIIEYSSITLLLIMWISQKSFSTGTIFRYSLVNPILFLSRSIHSLKLLFSK